MAEVGKKRPHPGKAAAPPDEPSSEMMDPSTESPDRYISAGWAGCDIFLNKLHKQKTK